MEAGTTCDPFPLDGPDGFFWAGPSLSHVLDLLHHLSQLSDLLLVVSGPLGAGKTTLLGELLHRGGEHWRHCLIRGSPKLTPHECISLLMAGFQLPRHEPSPEARQRQLETHLQALDASNVMVVIAVDDADRLPRATREYLLGLVEGWERLRVSVVLSSVAPAEQIAGVANAKGRVHHVELPALNESETGEYLEARMRRAGREAEIDEAVVRAIHMQSRGVPGAIHRLARALLDAPDPEPLAASAIADTQSLPTVRTLGLLLGAVALAAAAGWLVTRGRVPEGPGPSVARIAALPGQSAARPAGRAPTGPTAAAADAVDKEESTPRSAAPYEGADTVAAASPGVDVPRAALRSAPARRPEPKPSEADATPALHVVRSEATDVAPALDEGRPTESRPAVSLESAVDAAGTPAPPPAVPTPISIPAHIHDFSWISRQDPSQFAVQLMASHDPGDIGRFLSGHRLSEEVAWFKTEHENRDWYVLVTGPFPSRERAGAATNSLPQALRRAGPWTRPIADIVRSARP